jgi:hypothetical protein
MSCCIVHNNLRKISGKQLPKFFSFLSFSCIQKQQQEDNLHIYTKSSASWAFVASPEATTERQSACIYASTFAMHEHYRSNPTAAFNDMYMGMVCLCEVPFTMSHAFMRNPTILDIFALHAHSTHPQNHEEIPRDYMMVTCGQMSCSSSSCNEQSWHTLGCPLCSNGNNLALYSL